MKTVTVMSQKGGVGKTSTAWALVNGLGVTGRSVLAVDLDGQGDLTYSMGGSSGALLDVLQGKGTARAAVQHTDQGDLLAGSDSLALLDMYVQRNDTLRRALEPLQGKYDYCVIDTPPALGRATLTALTASDAVVVPVLADVLSVKQLQAALRTVEAVQGVSSRLRYVGILVTMFDRRPTLNRECLELLESVAASKGAHMFEAKVRNGVAIREAAARRENPFITHGRAGAVLDYAAFIAELIAALEGLRA